MTSTMRMRNLRMMVMVMSLAVTQAQLDLDSSAPGLDQAERRTATDQNGNGKTDLNDLIHNRQLDLSLRFMAIDPHSV